MTTQVRVCVLQVELHSDLDGAYRVGTAWEMLK